MSTFMCLVVQRNAAKSHSFIVKEVNTRLMFHTQKQKICQNCVTENHTCTLPSLSHDFHGTLLGCVYRPGCCINPLFKEL